MIERSDPFRKRAGAVEQVKNAFKSDELIEKEYMSFLVEESRKLQGSLEELFIEYAAEMQRAFPDLAEPPINLEDYLKHSIVGTFVTELEKECKKLYLENQPRTLADATVRHLTDFVMSNDMPEEQRYGVASRKRKGLSPDYIRGTSDQRADLERESLMQVRSLAVDFEETMGLSAERLENTSNADPKISFERLDQIRADIVDRMTSVTGGYINTALLPVSQSQD